MRKAGRGHQLARRERRSRAGETSARSRDALQKLVCWSVMYRFLLFARSACSRGCLHADSWPALPIKVPATRPPLPRHLKRLARAGNRNGAFQNIPNTSLFHCPVQRYRKYQNRCEPPTGYWNFLVAHQLYMSSCFFFVCLFVPSKSWTYKTY